MIRVLLVDDEQPARDRLAHLLSSLEDVEVVGEAEDGEQAIEKISKIQPDLVLLDIQMPGLSGLEVAASLPAPRPKIVFCTAFDQYAIDAFELHALDYLLKPVKRERLKQAVERVRQSVLEQDKLRQEMDTAREVQKRLFPQVLPAMKTLEYSGICKTAGAGGGDYYDFLVVGADKLGIALADVSGKGFYAGLLMASLQGQLQSYAPVKGEKVAELIADVNRRMCRSSDDSKYATFFYGVYDDENRTLTYVNAGHHAPMITRSSSSQEMPTDNSVSQCLNQAIRLKTGGTVVGLFPDARYQQETVEMRSGDTLVAFSDGVTEAINGDGEEFGEERLARLVAENQELSVMERRDLILRE
ncbi:SpoIIE family protein phosphatase, partial [Acidobacteria bacterium AH-259-L09]|nr:SpoIIE family protein phosphatase [Acidobacteria bacterium AH-259-L09]